MRLVILSDTHGFHRGIGQFGNPPLPEGDVLIHCGDFSRDFGSWLDAVRFASWMGGQPHAHKILCPGNHDYAVYENPAKAAALFKKHGITMVGVEMIEIDGVTFDGNPAMPVSGYDPAFGFEADVTERDRLFGRIRHVDVLLTHTPPRGILDRTAKGKNLGCQVLRQKVFESIRPRLHCFGHVHENRGVRQEKRTLFVNASSNTRGDYARDDLGGVTHMTMGIRDAYVFDTENLP